LCIFFPVGEKVPKLMWLVYGAKKGKLFSYEYGTQTKRSTARS
jgi:hypothetical protein